MSPHLILLGVALIVVLYLVTKNDPDLRRLLMGALTRFLPWR